MTEPSTLHSRWERVAALFDGAMALAPDERRAFLDRECCNDRGLRLEVEELLAADDHAGGVLDVPLESAAQQLMTADTAGAATSASGPAAGMRLGPYRVIRGIGSGGMGTVYLAERADGAYEQQVAIKVVRASPMANVLERRFLRERRILARLQHPNIARVLDAGVTESGAPFLVMEFVAGEPITQYCDSRSVSVDERLRLFLDVCAAVHFAHGNLVVHCDLKPGNILVTQSGQVRLLDFGIARLLDDAAEAGATRTGQLLLTPEYAAPEQIRGVPPNTATDLYALGAVLYELLSGHKAYELASRDLMQILRAVESDPPRLSQRDGLSPTLRRRLSGDLDAITHKALAREPARRYPSVESLASDVRRHLDDEPVSAQPESHAYRAAKFVRRHRVGVAAGAAIFAAITAGIIGIAWQSHRRGIEAHKAEEVKAFVLALFSGADPERARGEELTARELVEEGSLRIQRELADEPAVRAEVMTFLGDIHEKLGQPDKALTSVDGALQLLATLPGDNTVELGNATIVKARALLAKGDLDGATALVKRSVDLHRQSEQRLALAEDFDVLAILARQRGNAAEARDLTQQALDIRLADLGPEHPLVAVSYNNLGVVAREMGDLPGAQKHHETALAIRRRALPGNHPDIGVSLNNLGALLFAQGRYAEAEKYFRDGRVLAVGLHGEAHPRTIGIDNNLGSTLLLQAKYEEALPLFKGVSSYWETHAGAEHPNALVTLNNIASGYRGLARYEDAEPLYRKLIATWPKVVGPQHPNVAVAHFHLGTILLDRGALDDAERELTASLEIRRATRGVEHPEYADSLRELAQVALYRNQLDVADERIKQALAIQRKALPPTHPLLGASLLVQGKILRARSEYVAALAATSEGLQALRASFAADHPDVARGLFELARSEFLSGQLAEAARDLEQVRRVFVMRFSESSWRVADLDGWLAAATAARDPKAARARLSAAGRMLATQLPAVHPARSDNRRLAAVLEDH